MGLTAVMDDFDEERFARGPRSLAPAPAPTADRAQRAARERSAAAAGGQSGELPADGQREEVAAGSEDGELCVRVRSLGPEGERSIRAELQLLAALEVAGILAAPSVLSLEDDGYVRESGTPLPRGRGRRSASTSNPPTAERLALSRAREHLDVLVDALHERGWVLGAPVQDGLGRRADGSVLVLDLSGLRPEEGTAARQADRRWVDSVLGDQERTLRRRVDVPAQDWGEAVLRLGESSPLPAPGESPASPGPGTGVVRSAGMTGGVAEVEAGANLDPVPAGRGAFDTERLPLPVPRGQGRREKVTVIPMARRRRESRATAGAATPTPAGTSVPPTTLPPPGAATVPDMAAPSGPAAVPRTSTTLRRAGDAIRQVLVQRRLRRTAVLSAMIVLLLGTPAAGSAWWAGQRAGVQAAPRPPVATAAAAAEDSPAPEIDDAWNLAADLAGARHAYVTGVSEVSASSPGTSAFTADEETREAYEGFVVRGGGPVIHEAELISGTTAEGTAELRVQSSMAAFELEDSDGAVRTVPATSPETIQLTVRWDGAQWQVESVQRLPSTEAPGGS